MSNQNLEKSSTIIIAIGRTARAITLGFLVFSTAAWIFLAAQAFITGYGPDSAYSWLTPATLLLQFTGGMLVAFPLPVVFALAAIVVAVNPGLIPEKRKKIVTISFWSALAAMVIGFFAIPEGRGLMGAAAIVFITLWVGTAIISEKTFKSLLRKRTKAAH